NRLTGEKIGEPLAHEAAIDAIAFSTDGRILVTATHDGVIRRWNPATGTLLDKRNAVEPGVNSVCLLRGGETALVCRNENTIVLLDLTSDPIRESPLPMRGLLRSSTISVDGR